MHARDRALSISDNHGWRGVCSLVLLRVRLLVWLDVCLAILTALCRLADCVNSLAARARLCLIQRVMRTRLARWQRNLVGPVPGQKTDRLLARCISLQFHGRAAILRAGPCLRRPTGDRLDVGLRFLWQL